jgi:PAS domain S-box-containing protein
MLGGSDADIRILHIDDDVEFLDLSKDFLEGNHEDLIVETETAVQSGLDRVQDDSFDCVVCDYNMPSMNGFEVLESVREDHPDLPFILFTGKGSEEVASEAISAGVTDYLQKEVGPDQYTVLANRIRNAVSQTRAERQIEETRDFYQKILDYSSDFVIIVDPSGTIEYVSPAVQRVMGYPAEKLVGTNSFEFPHPDDRERAYEALERVLENPRKEQTVEYRAQHADGSWRWIEVRGQSLLDDPIINGIMVNVRDITERKQREQDLQTERDRLEDLTSFLEHDVRSQLNIIRGRVELAEDDIGEKHHDAVVRAVTRIEEMFENVMALAEGTDLISEQRAVSLDTVVVESWPDREEASLEREIDPGFRFEADPKRLQSLLENLLQNAIKHAGPEVTVNVGTLDDEAGFYVADDGPGIPDEEVDAVFDSDYTTSDGQSGLGLTIVQQIVEAHDWEIRLTDSRSGGAGFEITGIEVVD